MALQALIAICLVPSLTVTLQVDAWSLMPREEPAGGASCNNDARQLLVDLLDGVQKQEDHLKQIEEKIQGQCKPGDTDKLVEPAPTDPSKPSPPAVDPGKPAEPSTPTEPVEQCESGKSYNKVQKICLPLPEMMAPPEILPPRIIKNETIHSKWWDKDIVVYKFALFCRVNYTLNGATDDGARFLVTFLFDGNEMTDVEGGIQMKKFEVKSTNLEAELDEEYLRGRMGTKVTCKVQAYWEGSPDKSREVTSTTLFFVGIKPHDNPPTFDKTDPNPQLILESTVPITCWHCFMDYDKTTKDGAGAHFCYETCQHEFSIKKTGTAAKCDFLMTENSHSTSLALDLSKLQSPADSVKFVEFKPYGECGWFQNYPSIWRGYVIEKIKIQINKIVGPKTCSSVGDPHLRTFDGVAINSYTGGDFVLTRSLMTDGHVMEVQVRQQQRGAVAVICGVAAREDNSAYKIDFCDGKAPNIVQLLEAPQDASSVTRDGTGKVYAINFESGLTIQIDSTGVWYCDVIVTLPDRYSEVDGQCGNKDGNTQNDVLPPYDVKYQLNTSASMFQTAQKCVEVKEVTKSSGASLCILDLNDKPAGSVRATVKVPVNKVEKSFCGTEPPKNVDVVPGGDTFKPAPPSNNTDIKPPEWPTPLKKTEEDARKKCADVLSKSPVYAECKGIVDLDSKIQECIADIQAMDDYSVSITYRDGFEDACVEKNIDVADKICPNMCNGHGTCMKRKCSCEEEYLGADCSINKDTPPKIGDLPDDGMCDTHNKACTSINIPVEGITDNLKCHFTCTYQSQKANVTSDVVVDGKMITNSEMVCEWPQYLIDTTRELAKMTCTLAVQNVGGKPSDPVMIVRYDSKCLTCEGKDGQCQTKAGSCMIDNFCHANGTLNPTKECSKCVSSLSRTQWTDTSAWTDQSPCSVTCGTGTLTKHRHCIPKGDTGKLTEEETCTNDPCPVCKLTTNIALGLLTAFSSSALPYNPAPLATDGSKSTTKVDPDDDEVCFKSTPEQDTFWTVKLKKPVKVAIVNITNGVEDGYTLNDFYVSMSDTKPTQGLKHPFGKLCIHQVEELPQGATVSLKCEPDAEGQYVVIHRHAPSAQLILCEIEVFACE